MNEASIIELDNIVKDYPIYKKVFYIKDSNVEFEKKRIEWLK